MSATPKTDAEVANRTPCGGPEPTEVSVEFARDRELEAIQAKAYSRQVVVNITEEMNGLKAGNQRLVAERDAAIKDANRYRFLRSEKLVEMLGVFPTPDTCDVGLDHQIDAAMEASK
jgi:hypothetical protein